MQQVADLMRQYHEDVANVLGRAETSSLADLKELEESVVAQLQAIDGFSLEVQRELDHLPLRILFSWLDGGNARISESTIIERCDQLFGERRNWLEQYKRYRSTQEAIVLTVMTWQCEIRCTYCTIPKQSGREVSTEVLDQATDLLLSAPKQNLQMRYFGGEPLMEWDKLTHSIETTWNKANHSDRCNEKNLSFLITTNGIQLDEEKIKWLSRFPVRLQIALDGLPEAQDTHRRFVDSDESSYARSAIHKAAMLKEYGVPHTVILVVHPARIDFMLEDFQHIVDKGFEIIQINWAHNTIWHRDHLDGFAKGLHKLGLYLRERWREGKGPKLRNLNETKLKVRLAQELTVDWDGCIYPNTSFLFRPHIADNVRLGSLSDGRNWLHYKINYFNTAELGEESYAPKVFDNNAQVGTIFNHWIRWMADQGIPNVDELISTTYR